MRRRLAIHNSKFLIPNDSLPMPTEIERKFLVTGDRWRSLGEGKPYWQGYLTATPERSVRVRIAGDEGFLTIKGKTVGVARLEYEYAIPVDHAREILQTLCVPPLIQKTRYRVEWEGLLWEIDEFAGENQGLVIAEVELANADQAITFPDWIGEEVTHDPRYYNSNLAQHPFSQWGSGER
jgi:CYTH domain-containing protein